jgi:hypothetical protein
MPFKARRKAILLKNEATPGTDSVPVAGTDALLVNNFSFRPLVLQYDDRDYAVPYFGNKGRLVAGQYGMCSFEIEIAGAGGAVDAVAKWGPAMKSCGMSQTVNAATNVVYAPITTGEVFSTIYFYLDGRLHKLVFAHGSVEMRLTAGRKPVFAFEFIGLHVTPADAAMIAPTLSGFTKPLVVNNANTTPFTVHAFAGKIRELTLSLGNANVYRNLPNSEAIRFVDRIARGSVRLEDELVATKDWWTSIKNGTLGALAVTQGTVLGNRVAISAPNVQLTEPELDEEDGIAMIRMGMELQPSAAGNDELSITTT